jgi:hypothetical protein
VKCVLIAELNALKTGVTEKKLDTRSKQKRINMAEKPKGYTNKIKRMELYLEQINKLRMANICMREDLMVEAVHKLISLNCKFENEDNPKGT